MRRTLLVIVTIALWTAEAKAQQSLAPGLEALGVQVTRTESNKLTSLVFHCDEEKALAAIPTLQALGVVNPDITQTEINLAPVAFSSIIAVYAAIGYLQAAYNGSQVIDRVEAQVNLRVADDYGNLGEHTMFTFSFNRALYRKINWDHFRIAQFPKIAPKFRSTEWFNENGAN